MTLTNRLLRLLPQPFHRDDPKVVDVCISKVDDATPFIADLFRSTFGDPPPQTPTHYVAFARMSDHRCFIPVGYYHVSYSEEYALVGGLCVAEGARHLGIGQALERYVYCDAGDIKAYFAHVGDPRRAYRVGFIPTAYPHLVAYWVQPASDEVRERITHTVHALGPF